MYKLLIADDEEIIRNALAYNVDWSNLGFELVGALADGQEVIEYLTLISVDVILTDIRMVTISGIDIARHVHRHFPECRVVFISGYKEFDYALQGMKYGVNDFLVKPTDYRLLANTFNIIKQSLDKQTKQEMKTREEQERYELMVPMIKERFISDLVLCVIDNEEYARKKMNLLYPDIDTNKLCFFLANITINHYEEYVQMQWFNGYDRFVQEVGDYLRGFCSAIEYHIVCISQGQLEIIGLFVDNSSCSSVDRQRCLDELNNLIDGLSSKFKMNANGEILQMIKGLPALLHSRKQRSAPYSLKTEINILLEQKKIIISYVCMGSISSAQIIFNNMFKFLIHLEMTERNTIIFDLFSAMFKNMDIALAERLREQFKFGLLQSFTSTDELKLFCDRLFDRIRLYLSKVKNNDISKLIERILNYIHNNLDKDISLEVTANHFYISSSYLSRMFKKQINDTFVTYVTNVKMAKAAELLKDPNYKTYQIGEELGYRNPSYFSKLFKSTFGVTPGEYREALLHEVAE